LGFLEAPGDRQLRHRALHLLLGKGRQLGHLVQRSVRQPLCDHTPDEFVALGGGARSLRHLAARVLAAQEPGGERRPDGRAELVRLLEDRKVLGLEALAVHHVVLRLLELRRLETWLG
jgi:hypothetical protein